MTSQSQPLRFVNPPGMPHPLTYYLLDISQIPLVREVRDQFVNTQHPPASSAVEVRRLFRDGLLIEIEAIAVVPA
jgi:2-iminobutanoate/2-iminopropanoate deaminase